MPDFAPRNRRSVAPEEGESPSFVPKNRRAPDFKAEPPHVDPSVSVARNRRVPDSVAQALSEDKLDRGVLPPLWSSALRGATFGLSDKAIAKGRDLLDGPEFNNYQGYLNDQFAQRDEFAEKHPFQAIASELAGGIGLGGPITGLAKRGAAAVAPRAAEALASRGALPFTGRVASNIGQGAAYGAVGGAGQANTGQEASGAQQGGLIGAGASGALSMLGRGGQAAAAIARPAIQKMGHALGITDPNKWAEQEFMRTLGLDNMDPAALAREMGEMAGRGLRNPVTGLPVDQKQVMALDVVGPNTRSRLKSAAAYETPAKSDLESRLNNRSAEQADRLTDDIRIAISPDVNSTHAVDRIMEESGARAKPLWDQLNAMGTVDDPRVAAWFNANPARKDLFKSKADADAYIGKPMDGAYFLDKKGNINFRQQPSMKDLLELKKDLQTKRDSLVDDYGNAAADKTVDIGGRKYHFADINEQYKSYRDLLDAITPDGQGGSLYARARSETGEGFELKKAVETGRKVMKSRAEDLETEFHKLTTDPEREAFRTGVASQMFDSTQKGGRELTTVKKLYHSPEMKRKLQTIFPNEDAQKYFERMYATEERLAERGAEMLPRVSSSGSMSGGGVADNIGAGMAQLSMGRVGPAINRFMSGLGNSMAPEYADPLTRMGMLGPDEMEALARRIAEAQGSPRNRLGGALSAYGDAVVRGSPNAAAGLGGSFSERGIEGYTR